MLNQIKANDPQVYQSIINEVDRQNNTLELIASENFVSPAVLQANGSVLTNKYAEGYPGKRYYGGCEYVDKVEVLAIDRVKALFGADYANVQPHSGSQANMAVYFALLNQGDTILGMDLAHGGHLTPGAKVSFSGRLFNFVHYGVDRETQIIDYGQVQQLAKQHRPKMIVSGASAYPRFFDFKALSDIARSIDALLMVDMAHIAGLVAAGVHPSPIPHSDVVTSTTHKTLRGPRGGLILAGATAAVPAFLLGLLLIYVFGGQLGWFPLGGSDSPAAYVLPVLTLFCIVTSVALTSSVVAVDPLVPP